MYHQYPIRSGQTLNTIIYTTLTFFITRIASLRIMNIEPASAMILICLCGSFAIGLHYSRNRHNLLVVDQIHAVIQVLVLESATIACRAMIPLSKIDDSPDFLIVLSVILKGELVYHTLWYIIHILIIFSDNHAGVHHHRLISWRINEVKPRK